MSYLNRSGVSLNSINYVDTLANSNQILERTGTGRNNIAWNDPPSSIPSGLNATPSQVLSGYKFVGSAGTLQTGTIPTQGGSTITPGTSNKTAVSAGRYVSGNIIVAGDGDLIASNIRYGKNIFNVNGNIREYKQWTGQATTNSSRKSYKVNGGGTVSMYYLTINPGFTPKWATAIKANYPEIYSASTSWNAYHPNNSSGAPYQLNISDGISFTSSNVEIPVRSSGTYNVWISGYV